MRATGAGASPVTGDLPWARLRKYGAANQTVNSGTAPTVTWNDFLNDYAADFVQVGNFLRPLVDGVYSLLARLFWFTTVAPETAEIYFAGIDADNFAAYNAATIYSTFNSVSTAFLVARLAAGQNISVQVRQQSGLAWAIDGAKGSYFEAIRLGSATMTGRDFP